MAINKNKSVFPVLNRIQKPEQGARTAGVQGVLKMPTPKIATVPMPKAVSAHIVSVKF